MNDTRSIMHSLCPIFDIPVNWWNNIPIPCIENGCITLPHKYQVVTCDILHHNIQYGILIVRMHTSNTLNVTPQYYNRNSPQLQHFLLAHKIHTVLFMW